GKRKVSSHTKFLSPRHGSHKQGQCSTHGFTTIIHRQRRAVIPLSNQVQVKLTIGGRIVMNHHRSQDTPADICLLDPPGSIPAPRVSLPDHQHDAWPVKRPFPQPYDTWDDHPPGPIALCAATHIQCISTIFNLSDFRLIPGSIRVSPTAKTTSDV